jgi:hypothetical protein
VSDSFIDPLGELLQKKKAWYELPTPLAIPALVDIRDELREKNLHDTEEPPLRKRAENEPLPPNVKTHRSEDGTYTALT